jgi:5'-deoxynucleotidase YfbR-like HD superfamily hydrolase
MSDQIRRLAQALREGGSTQRLHTVPHHQDASNSRHSWNIAALLYVLWPDARRELVHACLFHDVAERWVGDTPAPAKYSLHPPLGRELHVAESKVEHSLGIMQEVLTPEEKSWLKGLDVLELVLYCHDEIALGNRHIEVTLNNARRVLDDAWVPEIIRNFAATYSWERTSDMIQGDMMERLTHEQHTTR